MRNQDQKNLNEFSKLSIRLLKSGHKPEDSILEENGKGKKKVTLKKCNKFNIKRYHIGNLKKRPTPPDWVSVLKELETIKNVKNNYAVGLVFVRESNRWFVISFGLGHVLLDQSNSNTILD